MRIGIYPGSFDPITYGHLDVLTRAARLVDVLIIGVLDNKEKNNMFTPDERVAMIREVVADIPNVKVEAFEGLLVDFARKKGAHVIIRGLRAVTDFEYELQMAQTNHKLNDEIETIFLTTNLKYSYLSSSVVRQVGAFDGELIGKFVPDCIVETVKDKCKKLSINGSR